MILTLTGASGAGKSTLAKAIMTSLKNSELSPGCTTRPLRPGETIADAVHMSLESFKEAKDRGDFLWTVEVHGEWYGTLRKVIEVGLADPKHCLILALTSEVLPILKSFAMANSSIDALKSVYVLAPELSELNARLSARGTSREVIERRLKDCLTWDGDAKHSGLYDLFIPGEGNVDLHAQVVINSLNLN